MNDYLVLNEEIFGFYRDSVLGFVEIFFTVAIFFAYFSVKSNPKRFL